MRFSRFSSCLLNVSNFSGSQGLVIGSDHAISLITLELSPNSTCFQCLNGHYQAGYRHFKSLVVLPARSDRLRALPACPATKVETVPLSFLRKPRCPPQRFRSIPARAFGCHCAGNHLPIADVFFEAENRFPDRSIGVNVLCL